MHCHAVLGKGGIYHSCLGTRACTVNAHATLPDQESSLSGLGFNYFLTDSLTSKCSTDVKDIKPVSADAIGQVCEVKGRCGE